MTLQEVEAALTDDEALQCSWHPKAASYWCPTCKMVLCGSCAHQGTCRCGAFPVRSIGAISLLVEKSKGPHEPHRNAR